MYAPVVRDLHHRLLYGQSLVYDDWEERVREEASAEQEVPKGANPDK